MRRSSKTFRSLMVTVVAIVAFVLSTSANANPQRVLVQAHFKAADADSNGQLNEAEFKTFIDLNADHKLGRASSVRRFGLYNEAFRKADANGDGVVSKEEITALVRP